MSSYDNIPVELREKHQWVVRDERKIPYNPITGQPASTTDPATWDSYENAVIAYLTGKYAGIGFVFTEYDPYVGVDYDHVRENGEWEAGYLDEILSFGSYAEVSPSGTGAHVITKGKIPGDRHRSGPREMYERGRYFTFTGNLIEGACPEIRQAQEAINTVYQIIDPSREERSSPPVQQERATTPDYEIIRKAEAAKNGDKFSHLMRGDWSGYYQSQSEADSALCCMLAFYTRDISQIDRIFRMSGLDRSKWMEKRGALTYGELTIQNALSTVKEQSSRSKFKNFRQPVTTQPERREGNTSSEPSPSSFIDENGKPNYIRIGRHLQEKYHTITHERTTYLYDINTGLYCRDNGEIESETQIILEECGYCGSLTRVKNEIRSYVRDHTIMKEYPFNNYQGIPVQNGVLKITFDTEAIEILPYAPEMFFTYQLPVTYDPEADSHEIEGVIRQWVEPEDADTLYQIPAQAILHQLGKGKPYKKCYLLQGDGDAGKTTYLELLYATFGERNCACVALQRMGTDRFFMAPLEGKLFNLYDELADIPLHNTEALKKLTGGFYHEIEKKRIDSYEGRIFAVHVFSCNKPPSVDERYQDDTAFWDRWEYVIFPHVFDKDPTFNARYYTPENISGFFNAVLKTVILIRKNGLLLTESSAFETRNRWNYNSDPLYRFLEENLEKDQNGAIPKEVLHGAYLSFCRYENIEATKIHMALNTFAKKMFSYGAGESRPRTDGKRVQSFTGFRWMRTSRYQPEGTDQASLSRAHQAV